MLGAVWARICHFDNLLIFDFRHNDQIIVITPYQQKPFGKTAARSSRSNIRLRLVAARFRRPFALSSSFSSGSPTFIYYRHSFRSQLTQNMIENHNARLVHRKKKRSPTSYDWPTESLGEPTSVPSATPVDSSNNTPSMSCHIRVL